MKLKNYIIATIVLLFGFSAKAQYTYQKKADNLFNKFAFANAAKVYHELIDENFNADYATRQLADSYAFMRNPDSAVVYYKKAVQQKNVPVEYYYNYAQALRGIKDYEAYRIWMKRFKDAGGSINEKKLGKDSDFINSIFNAKQQYFLTNINFNSKFSDFGAYEHNGSIYFVSSRDERALKKHTYGWNNEPFLDIYSTIKSNNDSIVDYRSKLKGNINSVYHEGSFTITKNGKTIYFSRTNFNKNVLGKDKEGITNLKIYKASLIEGKWTNIEELPFNNNEFSNAHPALNEDETKLYFASNKYGGYGGSDIYYVDINKDGSFGTPKNLGNVVNTNKNERFPFINSEGSLFFASDGHPGLGLLDIFGTVSDKNNNITSVINLGVPVNSSKDDFSFFMNPDGLSGYFASNRNGGVGSDDIFAYDRIPQLKIEGTVTEAINNSPIPNALVTLLDSDGKEIAFVETNENGQYDINIDRNADYNLKVKKETYIESSSSISSKNIERHITSIPSDFAITPEEKLEEKEEIIPIAELYPIYFDFNKSNIRKDGTTELDRIVDLMQIKYPNMVVKIESHTDSRGPSSYNYKLSEKRAKVAYNYLINHGVNPNRIIEYKGYGEQKLINNCDGTIRCTEAEHQLNRRTQFSVIRMK
ncbi:OmpA family protein [Flaviramulus sp. BrNp1-15]|uniref:OmpA family protein n=1 Tax=Flaviramulus sp. BrNp1-15 TaxID=2916754 RepID=UPI001EE978FC|nr:OmpA family protein [Flaviramulus sp. BrNp1-15]ULC58106.1 OmpA family protein [Flaviramulus sp. BrNp1-15]